MTKLFVGGMEYCMCEKCENWKNGFCKVTGEEMGNRKGQKFCSVTLKSMMKRLRGKSE